MRSEAPHPQNLVLLGLEGRTDGISAGSGVAGAYGDLIGSAMAIALVILAILHITGNTVVDVVTAVFLFIHFHFIISPFG